MTLLELYNYVIARYPTEMTTTEVKNHINEVYLDLSRPFTADVRETTTLNSVSTTDVYTVTRSTRRITDVYRTDSGDRQHRLRQTRYETLVYPRNSGEPTHWYPYGLDSSDSVYPRIGLEPEPDAIYQFEVLYEPQPTSLTDLTDDSVPTYVPTEYHHLIGDETIVLLAAKQQEYSVAQFWDEKFRTEWNEIIMRRGWKDSGNFPMAKYEALIGGGGQK